MEPKDPNEFICGDIGESQPVDPEVQAICDSVHIEGNKHLDLVVSVGLPHTSSGPVLHSVQESTDHQRSDLEQNIRDMEPKDPNEFICGDIGESQPAEPEVQAICDSKSVMASSRKQKIDELLSRLHLLEKYENNLTSAEFLQIRQTKEHDQDICESDLSSVYLHKLLMLDYRARHIQAKQETNTCEQIETDDCFDMAEADENRSEQTHIHPMDVQMAVFHCSDTFLKQKIVTKLSQCQYALPLLVPDPFTEDIQCPLWTFRQIQKTWKKTETKDNSNVVTMKSMPIYKAETPMVFCFRLGSLSVSKSQFINTLINDRHSTFFHRNCPGSSKSRVLFEGVAEIAWYCPAGKQNDSFTDCVAFCNLHGDGLSHDKQLDILKEMSSVNVVFVQKMDRDHASAAVIKSLQNSSKPLIVLIENSSNKAVQLKNGAYIVGLKDRSQSDVSEELKRIIRDILSAPHKSFQLEFMSDTGFRLDENNTNCTNGLSFASEMMKIIETVDESEVKKTFLPCQGQLWHDWCKINKELYRLKGNIEVEKSKKQSELKRLREDQCKLSCSELIQSFIKPLSSSTQTEREYFIKWTQILLDAHGTDSLSSILQKYDEKWSEILDMKTKPDKSDELKSKKAELEKLSNDLQFMTCGLEHIFREMVQIYEAHKSLNKPPKEEQTDWSKYPELAAELMISGHPMELMDGEAGYVPLTWISSVIDQVIHRLGDKKVFVLSVLGIQSSGKSTMLNAMFGLQFAVSAGRCTRGAFMQLVKLSDEMKKVGDYILVVDTEGLRALELEGNTTFHHDNELATFVVGVGNMTLVNIFGENPSEMQDILQIVVQAFMRMKKVKLSPSCVFVHQNVSDVSAVEKTMDGKRKLQEKLDVMAQLAAKEEGHDAESFSDIIKFDVQNDVKYFAQLWEGSPPMAPPNPDYSECVQDLRSYILLKALKSPSVKLSAFKTKVHDLWNALLNENFVFSFRNTLEIAVYRKLEVEYGNWTWALRQEMLNIEEKLYPRITNGTLDHVDLSLLHKEVKSTFDQIKKSMSEYFENEKDKEILIQWRGQHELKINTFHDEMVQGLQRKLNNVIEQKKASKEFEERKTMFEKDLLQKSKDLAHKLRDKTQDDLKLKKQFDHVWREWVSELTQGIKPAGKINLQDDLMKAIQECGFEMDLISSRLNSEHYRNLAKCGDYSEYVQKTDPKTNPSPNPSPSSSSSLSLTTLWKKTVDVAKTIRQTFTGRVSHHYQDLTQNYIIDVEKEASELIKTKPLAAMGYNPSYLSEMSRNVKTSMKEFELQCKFSLKKEFKVDLILYVFDRIKRWILESHDQFIKNNDALTYLDSKKNEYFNVFRGFCKGSSSAVVLTELICDKLKSSMTEAVINQTAIDIAGELRCNVPAFKENRLNLEKHVLKSLAKKKDFQRYIHYIKKPRSYTETFITEQVETLLGTEYKDKCQSFFEAYISNLQTHIRQALQDVSEKIKSQNRDIVYWLQEFTTIIKDKLTFGTISSENFTDVKDFDFLKEQIEKGLDGIGADLKKLSVDKLKKSRQRPDQILIDQLCDCCWEKCPFCAAVCTNTVKDHKTAKEGGIDHSVPFHRSGSLKGWHYRHTVKMSVDFCTTKVAGDGCFYPDASDRTVPHKTYRSAGPPYDTWSITPDLFKLSYWQWVVCTFKDDLEKHYNLKYEGDGEIPKEWKEITFEEAIRSLEEMYK
ncbi:interferon-induced very large GTPase 1-like isoform X2 [Periophthalmus magnuspinnatus]|nr:interferon-induced very large GTPase 1-like isoform X2 [Periophthalmus magnuspinnatus]